eukprot:4038009-Alexandrium_andersonii.AAC.1
MELRALPHSSPESCAATLVLRGRPGVLQARERERKRERATFWAERVGTFPQGWCMLSRSTHRCRRESLHQTARGGELCGQGFPRAMMRDTMVSWHALQDACVHVL